MEIIKTINSKARKQHICNFCNSVIEIGETYESQTIVDSGSFYVWKSHHKCIQIADFLNMFDETYGEGLTSDDFCESIQDEFSIIMSEMFTENYESDNFKHKLFDEKLNFVCKYYLTDKNPKVKNSMLL